MFKKGQTAVQGSDVKRSVRNNPVNTEVREEEGRRRSRAEIPQQPMEKASVKWASTWGELLARANGYVLKELQLCRQPMLEQAHLEGLQPTERTYIGAVLQGLLPTQGPNTETGESMRWKKQQRGTVMN